MADILDQSNYTGSTAIGFGDTGNARDYMVQGFIPTLASVTAISFYVNSKDSNTNIGYKVWIDTCDSSSTPTNGIGGIGGVTLITNAQINTGGLTKYTLTTPVTVTPGNRYVMAFGPWDTVNDVFASSYHDFISSTANPYANGRRQHTTATYVIGWSAPDAGADDILFETYATGGRNSSSNRSNASNRNFASSRGTASSKVFV